MSGSDNVPKTATRWRDSILEDLGALSDSNLRRRLRLLSGPQGPLIRFEGREVIHLAGNNYLGLADHPALAEAAAGAASEWGSSAAASPLISGYMEPHEKLSRQLARFKDKEAFEFHQDADYHQRLVPPILDCVEGEMDLQFFEWVA